MLSKGFFYFALLIANGFLPADAHSPYANQVEFGYTNGDLLAHNSNVDNNKFLSGSGYEVDHSFYFLIRYPRRVSF